MNQCDMHDWFIILKYILSVVLVVFLLISLQVNLLPFVQWWRGVPIFKRMPIMSAFAFSQLVAVMALSLACARSSTFGSMPLCNKVGGIPWMAAASGVIGTIVFAFHPKVVNWAMIRVQTLMRRQNVKHLQRKELCAKWLELDLVVRITVAEAFWIMTVEAILKDSLHASHSPGAGVSSWQFGQILAMFLVLGPMFNLLKTVRERWLRKELYPSTDIMQERRRMEELQAEEGLRTVKLKSCSDEVIDNSVHNSFSSLPSSLVAHVYVPDRKW